MVSGHRVMIMGIECRAGNPLLAQSLEQRFFLDQRSASWIQQAGMPRQGLQLFFPDNAIRFFCPRQRQHQKVQVPKEFLSQVVERIRSEISIRKRALTDEEIREIAAKVKASPGK